MNQNILNYSFQIPLCSESIRIAWISKLDPYEEFSFFKNCYILSTHPSTAELATGLKVPLVAVLLK